VKLVERIVSGGQTGVDRAALDVALELGIPCGGWCPRGRRADDGRIPARYPLTETGSPFYKVRTERNVRDSDGTLILNLGKLDGGTAYTARMAKKHGKPCLIVSLDSEVDPRQITEWLRANNMRCVNIAGPREGKRPGVYAAARDLLLRVFSN
jgi:hypothetical protein